MNNVKHIFLSICIAFSASQVNAMMNQPPQAPAQAICRADNSTQKTGFLNGTLLLPNADDMSQTTLGAIIEKNDIAQLEEELSKKGCLYWMKWFLGLEEHNMVRAWRGLEYAVKFPGCQTNEAAQHLCKNIERLYQLQAQEERKDWEICVRVFADNIMDDAQKNGHSAVIDSLNKLLIKHDAAQKRRMKILSRIWDEFINIHEAAQWGAIDAIKQFIELGEDINRQNEQGITPFMIAAERGNLKTIQWMIANGAEINYQSDNGNTALIMAVKQGHLPVVQALIDHKVQLDNHDSDGMSALMWAVEKGHTKIFQLLLENGATVDLKTNTMGITAFTIAAERGNSAMIQKLKNAGAELDQKDSIGRTPFMIAALRGHETALRLLIELGADVNLQDNRGETALLLAARNWHYECCKAIVDVMLNKAKNKMTVKEEIEKIPNDAIKSFLLKRYFNPKWKAHYDSLPPF